MPNRDEDRTLLAWRIREIRRELVGEDGVATLARALHLPTRTWMNYEMGVTIPATVILQLIETFGVSPHWLLTGKGPRSSQARSAENAGRTVEAEPASLLMTSGSD